jgi:hypothetical protein
MACTVEQPTHKGRIAHEASKLEEPERAIHTTTDERHTEGGACCQGIERCAQPFVESGNVQCGPPIVIEGESCLLLKTREQLHQSLSLAERRCCMQRMRVFVRVQLAGDLIIGFRTKLH